MSWLGGYSCTPRDLGLTPDGSEFHDGVKKNPLVYRTPKHMSKALLRPLVVSHGGLGATVPLYKARYRVFS